MICLPSFGRFALGALFCGSLAGMAFAYPANPFPRTIDNGGDSLTISTFGDEHYRFTQTDDGFLVVSDSNGVYFYADEEGLPSKFKAKNSGRRSAADKAFLNGLDKKKVRTRHRERHPDRLKRPDSKQKPKRASWVPTAESTGASSAVESVNDDVPPVLMLPKANSHANGTNRFPVIMVENNSVKNMDSATVHAILNKENYRSNNYKGSVRDYFVDQSGGLFVPTFDLYLVKVEDAFVNYIGKEYALIQKSITALKSKYSSFDATLYDANKDGDIDAFMVLFAGGEVEAVVNNETKHLGGFQYELRWNACGKLDAGNGKKFNNYFIIKQAEYLFPTFIHEFSHTMGLKDHYCVWSDDCYNNFSNSNVQAPGAHAWDVMATGMYNGQNNPPNYNAFERNFMGWLEYVNLENDQEVKALPPLGSVNYAYKLKVTNDEWYVFENRQKENDKWDGALPNHGMLVWHIDYDYEVWNGDALNDDPKHQRVDVVEAGNLRVTNYSNGFTNSGGKNLVDDPFPGSQKVTKLSPILAWNGSEVLAGLFNITEKDTTVCFAVNQNVAVDNCVFAVSSSSEAVTSSSSQVVLSSSSVASSSSEVKSSSSVVKSSSSFGWPWRSSSSSEAVLESSSSMTVGGIAGFDVVRAGFEARYEGGALNVYVPVAGLKTVRVFDLQGHLLLTESFDGTVHGINHLRSRVRGAHGGLLVVRVDVGGRALGYGTIGVR